MAFIRMIVVFLLGVGAAAGVIATGAIEQMPSLLRHAEDRLGIAPLSEREYPVAGHVSRDDAVENMAGARPTMVLHISGISGAERRGGSDCPPSYEVRNSTDRMVTLSLGRAANNDLEIPPGRTLVPASASRNGFDDRGNGNPQESYRSESDCPTVRIELEDRDPA